MEGRFVITVTVLLFFFRGLAGGQTCCSGGVPLSANLGLPPEEGRTLQLNLNYDLNALETLKAGLEKLDDNSRSRRTHSVLLQAGYSFSDRLSVDALFSWVRQERSIRQFGGEDFTATDGLGDGVFLVKYKLLATFQNQTVISGALGVKAPFGRSDLRRTDGLTINADLQPGSGAWDGIAWAQIVHALNVRPTMALSGTIVYSRKGENAEYLGDQIYQFGNEWQATAALSDRLAKGKVILDPSLSLRYRHVGADRFNGQEVPSTGGQWVFINPGLSYWFNPDLAFNARVEIPLFADITGTQVSPTYRINAGFFARINFKNELPPGSFTPGSLFPE